LFSLALTQDTKPLSNDKTLIEDKQKQNWRNRAERRKTKDVDEMLTKPHEQKQKTVLKQASGQKNVNLELRFSCCKSKLWKKTSQVPLKQFELKI
jgi:hypothetical protein